MSKLTPELLKMIRHEAKTIGVKHLARKYDVNYWALKRAFRGVFGRGRRLGVSKGQPLNEKAIRKDYLAGISCRKLALRYGCSKSLIHLIATDQGRP